jgi:DNA repair exonuclease SbcCD ATPase subunit
MPTSAAPKHVARSKSPKPKKLSASERIALELQEAESELHAVEPQLQEARQVVLGKRKIVGATRRQVNSELSAQEESAAAWKGQRNTISSVGAESCDALVGEEASLQERLRDVEARHSGVDEAVASELYWRWRGVFEAHLRAGGRFEDFSLDGFFRDCYGVTLAENLKAPWQKTQDLRLEQADLAEHASDAMAAEAELRLELAALQAELKKLRHEVREQESTNHVWWQGQLSDKPRLHEIRGEQNRWHLEYTELQMEREECRNHLNRASDYISRQRAEAAELRARVLPCEELVSVMENSFEVHEEHGERFKQTIEMKELQLFNMAPHR